ncbi:MAG: hypothetical protein AAF589_07115, partial [Planctomycetota bacterium]
MVTLNEKHDISLPTVILVGLITALMIWGATRESEPSVYERVVSAIASEDVVAIRDAMPRFNDIEDGKILAFMRKTNHVLPGITLASYYDGYPEDVKAFAEIAKIELDDGRWLHPTDGREGVFVRSASGVPGQIGFKSIASTS